MALAGRMKQDSGTILRNKGHLNANQLFENSEAVNVRLTEWCVYSNGFQTGSALLAQIASVQCSPSAYRGWAGIASWFFTFYVNARVGVGGYGEGLPKGYSGFCTALELFCSYSFDPTRGVRQLLVGFRGRGVSCLEKLCMQRIDTVLVVFQCTMWTCGVVDGLYGLARKAWHQ